MGTKKPAWNAQTGF